MIAWTHIESVDLPVAVRSSSLFINPLLLNSLFVIRVLLMIVRQGAEVLDGLRNPDSRLRCGQLTVLSHRALPQLRQYLILSVFVPFQADVGATVKTNKQNFTYPWKKITKFAWFFPCVSTVTVPNTLYK